MATGIEMLLTSAMKASLPYLGKEIEAVKQLVASGQLDKIVRFADQLEELNENIKALRNDMRELKAGSGAADCERDDLAIRSIAYLNGGS